MKCCPQGKVLRTLTLHEWAVSKDYWDVLNRLDNDKINAVMLSKAENMDNIVTRQHVI